MFRSTNWPSSPPVGVELQGEPALGEVELDAVCSRLEASPNVCLGLAHEIGQKLLARVSLDSVLRIDQADRGGGDHRLLDRRFRLLASSQEKFVGMASVTERSLRQPGQLPLVPVGERNDHPVRSESVGAVEGIGGEARFSLFAVGDHRRTGLLEQGDSVGQRTILVLGEGILADPSGSEFVQRAEQMPGARDAADRLSRDGHRFSSGAEADSAALGTQSIFPDANSRTDIRRFWDRVFVALVTPQHGR